MAPRTFLPTPSRRSKLACKFRTVQRMLVGWFVVRFGLALFSTECWDWDDSLWSSVLSPSSIFVAHVRHNTFVHSSQLEL